MVFLFYAVSKQQCWWVGEGGMHWACGGDIMMQSSADSGQSWSTAKVRRSRLAYSEHTAMV